MTTRLDWELLDTEGRYIQVDFPGRALSHCMFHLVHLLMRRRRARTALWSLYEHLKALRRKRREFIICADWNTCHQNIDLKIGEAIKELGIMPHERAWLDRIR